MASRYLSSHLKGGKHGGTWVGSCYGQVWKLRSSSGDDCLPKSGLLFFLSSLATFPRLFCMQNFFNSWIMYINFGALYICIFCICSCKNWFVQHHKNWGFPAYLNFMGLSKLHFQQFFKDFTICSLVFCCFKQNIFFLMTCAQLCVPQWLYWTRIQLIPL